MKKISLPTATMSRRRFVTGTAAGTAALSLGLLNARPVRAQGRVVVRIGSVFRVDSIVPDVEQEFMKFLQDYSKGEFDPKFYPSESLGDAMARNEKLQAGTLEVSNTSESNFAAYVPLFNAFLFPYVTRGNEGGPQACIDNGIKITQKKEFAQAANKAANDKGFVLGFWTPLGVREYGVSPRIGKPAKVPDDFKGVKVRVTGAPVERQMFQFLGANPVPIPGPEIFTSMQSGVADAYHIDAVSIYTQGFYKTISAMTRTAFYPVLNLYVASKLWFDRLPQHLQKAFTQACTDAAEIQRTQFKKADDTSVAEIKKGGVEVYVPTAAEYQKLYDAVNYKRPEWEPLIKNLVGDVETFQRLVAL